MKKGIELGRRLHENDIDWWDRQLEEYQALPDPDDPSAVWRNFYGEDREYWVLTSKSMHYAFGSNVSLELSSEVAQHTEEFEGICLNPATAADLDVGEGESIVVQTDYGEVEGDAIVREGIRPDVVLIVGQFGRTVTPHAENLRIPNINEITTLDSLDLIDGTGSIAQLAKGSLKKPDD